MQVAGAGERFVLGQMEADLGRCGCCTLVLHLLGWFEPATTRLQDAPAPSKRVVCLAISVRERVGRRKRPGMLLIDPNSRRLGSWWSLRQVTVRRQLVGCVPVLVDVLVCCRTLSLGHVELSRHAWLVLPCQTSPIPMIVATTGAGGGSHGVFAVR